MAATDERDELPPDGTNRYRDLREFAEPHYPIGDLTTYLGRHLEENVHDVARDVLRYDDPGTALVLGVDAKARAAFLYHCEDRYIARVGVTESGLNDRGGPVVAECGEDEGPDPWIDRRTWDGAWLHPRYLEK